MVAIAPDDLVPGDVYTFEYETASKKILVEKGVFVKMSVYGGLLWLHWSLSGGEIPFDYYCHRTIYTECLSMN